MKNKIKNFLKVITVTVILNAVTTMATAQPATYVKETFNTAIPYNTYSPGKRVTTTDWLQNNVFGIPSTPNDFRWINVSAYPTVANQNIVGFPSGAGFVRYINRNIAYTFGTPDVNYASSGSAAILVTRALDFSGRTTASVSKDTLGISVWRDNTTSANAVADYIEVYINTSPNLDGATLLNISSINNVLQTTAITQIYRSSALPPTAAIVPNNWNRYTFKIPNLPDYISATGGSSNVYIIVKAVSAGGNNIYLDNFNLPQWPTPMVMQSAVLYYQEDTDLGKNSTNNLLLGVKVITKGSTGALKLDGISFSPNGSTNWLNDVVSSVSNAPAYMYSYFTGGSSNFNIGTGTVSMPYNTTVFNGDVIIPMSFGWYAANCSTPLTPAAMTLNPGSENYVWFAVDVKPGASTGNKIGAEFQYAIVRNAAATCEAWGAVGSSTNIGTTPITPQSFGKNRQIAPGYVIPTYNVGTSYSNYTSGDIISAVQFIGEKTAVKIDNYEHDFACNNCVTSGGSFCNRLSCHPPDYINFSPVNAGIYKQRTTQVVVGQGMRTGTPPYTLKAQCGTFYTSNGVAVFIDWNRDGDFDDRYNGVGGSISENYGTQMQSGGAANMALPLTTWTANSTWSIHVPDITDAVIDLNDPLQPPNNSTSPIIMGGVRLRIREAYAETNINPNQSGYNYGETEDYTIYVIAPCSNALPNECKWLGNNSNWNDPVNWCPNIPTAADDARIPYLLAPMVYPKITDNTNAYCKNLKLLDNGSGLGGQLNIDATNNASLSITDSVVIGYNAPAGGSTSAIKINSVSNPSMTIPAKSVLPPAGIAIVNVTPFRTNAQGKTQISYTALELSTVYGWKAGDYIDSIGIEVNSITLSLGASGWQNFRIRAFSVGDATTTTSKVYPFPVPLASSNTHLAVETGDAGVNSTTLIYSGTGPLNSFQLNMPMATLGTKAGGNYLIFPLIANAFQWDGKNLVLSIEYNTPSIGGISPAKNYVLYDENAGTFRTLVINYSSQSSTITGWNIDGNGRYAGGTNAGILATTGANRPRLDFSIRKTYSVFPITVGGNWINNNLSNAGFIAGKSTVTFNGNKNSAIMGNSTTFCNAAVHKSMGTKKVTLNTNITIDSVLALTKGKLLLNQNVLTLNNSSANAINRISGSIISENNIAPYGAVNWKINTSITQHIFPFSNSNGVYIPFSYTQKNGNAGYVAVSTFKTVTNNLPYPSGVTNVNDTNGINNAAYTADRFWQISRSGNSGSAKIKFTYANNEAPAPIVAGNLEVNRYNTATNLWERFNGVAQVNTIGAAVSSVQLNTVTNANFSSGQSWTLSDTNSPLRIAHELSPVAQVYPNPFNDFIAVQLNENTTADYFIYDATARVVLRGTVVNNSEIKTSTLTPGTYSVQLKIGDAVSQRKMVKL